MLPAKGSMILWGRRGRDGVMFEKEIDFQGLLRHGASTSPVGVVLVDVLRDNMPIVFANQAFFDITGYYKKEVLGKNCRFLQGRATDKNTIMSIRKLLRDRRRGTFTILNYRKDGAKFWNQLTLSPVINSDDVCTHYIGFQQDITKQLEQESLLRYQAEHDVLTGLINANKLEQVLAKNLCSANEDKKNIFVMHINLDGFKTVNDGLGYHVGNALIKHVAARLNKCLCCDGALSRLNGDEFVFVFVDFESVDQADGKAKEILNCLLEPFFVKDFSIHVSASIGISCNDRYKETCFELMQKASIAMKEAKRVGRNTWCWSSGQSNKILNNEMAVNLRYELNSALLNDQFELFYQPIINVATGEVNSYEALIRWRHPIKGLISPGVFIPVAEQTGQIVPLGYWILKKACSDIVTMTCALGKALPVAVNISALQFMRSDFFEIFLDLISGFDLAPELIQIEVTESLLIEGSDKAIHLVEKFREIGVKVSLDDFGTGYSSLSYLRYLPIDKVKLDMSFINGIDKETKSAAIVQAVIDMSHSLGLKVVAEGVETESQLQTLKGFGCDLLQGFWFSKPLPLEDIIEKNKTLYIERNR